MREYLFDDWNSVVHAVYGVIAALLVFKGYGVISVILFFVYLVYELLEPERPVATVGDVVEFMVGYIIASMVVGGIVGI